jgi:hypothetical protein
MKMSLGGGQFDFPSAQSAPPQAAVANDPG